MKRKLLFSICMLLVTAYSYGQLNENFEGTFPPTDWTLESGSGDWDKSNQTSDHTSGSGYYARYNCYSINGTTPAGLITPTLSVTSGDKTFTFWANYYFVEGVYGSDSELYIDVSADGGSNWTTGTTNYISGKEGAGWFSISIDLGDYESQNFVGSIVVVKFRGISDWGSYNIGIDDVVGPATAGVNNPTTFVATAASSSEIDLDWTLNASNDNVLVAWSSDGTFGTPVNGSTYGAGNSIAGGGTVLYYGSALHFDHQSLSSNTQYFYKAWSYDGSDYSSGMVDNATTDFIFVTQNLPFTDDFETNLDAWFLSGTTTPELSTDEVYDGSNSLSFNTTSGTNSSVTVQLGAGTTPMLTFWYYIDYYSSNDLTVDIKEAGASTWTTTIWQEATTYSTDDTWLEAEVDLSPYNTSGDFQLRFNAENTSSYSNYIVYMDDVSVVEVTCPAPTALMVDNISQTSADLGWTTGGASTWDIEWGPAGFTQGTGTMITGTTDNPYTLSGLTAGTNYDWYVRDDCGGGQSDWVGPSSFSTLPGAQAFPLMEDFESGFTSFNNATGNTIDWVLNTSLYHSSTTSAHNAHGSSNSNILHETGLLDLSSTSSAVIEFWQIAKTEGGYDKCFVEISVDGGSTYTALPASSYQGSGTGYATAGYFDEDDYTIWGTSTEIPDNTWWRMETFSLASYNTTNVRFRFRLTSDGSANRAGWYLDDIHIYEPSCPTPSSLSSSNETTTGADLGWTDAAGSHWDLYMVPAGDPAPEAATTPTINDITTNPYTWTGGTASSSYDWYVRSDCGQDNANVSAWSGPDSFNTLCEAIAAPYTQNFDGVTAPALPNCWSSIVNSTSSYAVVENSTTSPNSTPNNAKLYNSGDASATLLLISPEFSDLTSQARRIKFYAKGVSIYELLVGTMSDPADETTFTVFETVAISSTYAQYSVDFNATYTGTDSYIAFKHALGGTYQTIYIDDCSYEVIQAVAPNPATVSFPTDGLTTLNNPMLSWIPSSTGEPATGYRVYMDENNPPTTEVYDGTALEFQTSGLTLGTQYFWQVVPYNANGDATGVSTWSFTIVADGYLAESFESTTFPPTGWTNPGSWGRSTSQHIAGEASAYKSTSTTKSLLRTPMVTVSGTSTLDFFARTSASNTYQRIQVQYSQDDVTYTDIGAEIVLASAGDWAEYSIDLSSLAGDNYYLALAAYNTSSSGSIYVDHLIGPMVAALAPDAVTLTTPADAAMDQTATPSLAWTAAATGGLPTGFKVYLDETTDPTALYADVASSPYTVAPALNYSTTYYWKVVAYNTTGEAPASEIRSFTTMADPTLTPPFTETFDTYLPTNWGEAAGLLAAPVVFTSTTSGNWIEDGFANIGSTGAAGINIYGTSRKDWLKTPPIDLGDGSIPYRLTFDLALTDYGSSSPPETDGIDDKFAVVISTDNGATWTSVNTLMLWDNAGSTNVYNDISNTGETIIIDLSSYTSIVQLAFYGESTVSNADNDLFVDNVTVEAIPSGPVFVVSPESKDFGTINAGEISAAETFTISNNGLGTLQITGVVLAGTNADQFDLTDANTYPVDLTSGQSITVDVAFTPTSAGEKTATLDISDDQGGEVHQVTLTGTGFVPPQGSICSNPLTLAIPAVDIAGNTGDFGDDYSSTDVSPSSSYLNGDEVVYEFTVSTGTLTGTITTTNTYLGAFILSDCPNSTNPPTPLYVHSSGSGNSVTVFDDIEAGTYYLIISSWPTPQSISYYINLSLTEHPTNASWKGSIDNDWANAANWVNNEVPGFSTDVIIPAGMSNYPTITAAAKCNNLTIQSDDSGDGSLIGQSYLTVNGTTTIQRYTTAGKWHGISGPLANDDFNSLYFDGNPDVWGMYYNEDNNDYTYETDLDTELGDAKGWMVWIDGTEAQSFNFTGNLRSGTVGSADNMVISNADGDHGYNFVGNPFPSAIDWNTIQPTTTSLGDGIWIWNDVTDPDDPNINWVTYSTTSGGLNGGTRYISVGQGFFVQVNSSASSGTLQIAEDAQVHNGVDFMKVATVIPNNFIKLQLSDGDRTDESIIRLDASATEGYDSQFDMHKMFSWSEEQPQLYSTANNFMAINVLPQGTVSVPMDVRGVDGNEMTIAIEEVTDFDQVYLSDDYTGEQTNLMERPYTFVYDANQTDRFTVYFTIVGTVENPLENVQAYSFDQKIRVVIPMEMNAHVEVTNMLGQTVKEMDTQLGTHDINMAHRGYYLVTITGDNQRITRKVFIK